MDSEYQSAEFQCYTIGSCRVEVVQLTIVCIHSWEICSVCLVKADSSWSHVVGILGCRIDEWVCQLAGSSVTHEWIVIHIALMIDWILVSTNLLAFELVLIAVLKEDCHVIGWLEKSKRIFGITVLFDLVNIDGIILISISDTTSHRFLVLRHRNLLLIEVQCNKFSGFISIAVSRTNDALRYCVLAGCHEQTYHCSQNKNYFFIHKFSF